MTEFNANEKAESLYNEGIHGPVRPRKYGSLRRRLSKYLIPLVLWTGLGLSPPEAKAQDGYIAGISWCDSNNTGSRFYKVFAIQVDATGNPNGDRWVALVPGHIRSINFTGLKAGERYELRVQTCIIGPNGGETCSADSRNKPITEPRLYGNAYRSPIQNRVDTASGYYLTIAPFPSADRVDMYDLMFCRDVANRSMSQSPILRVTNEELARCDSDGDGSVGAADLEAIRRNYGRKQESLMGNNLLDCSTPLLASEGGGTRCPETDTCDSPYGKPASISLANYVALQNPGRLLKKGPGGEYPLVEVGKAPQKRRVEWGEPSPNGKYEHVAGFRKVLTFSSNNPRQSMAFHRY